MRSRHLSLLALPIVLAACSSSSESGDDYDQGELAAFKRAIPTEERLGAYVPEAADAALLRAETASLAEFAIEGAVGVNRPAVAMVRLLKAIVKLPPTLFDSAEKKFLWGPWPNDNGAGDVAVYIQENDAGDDMKYGYAFLRTMDGDLAKAKPVIWGGATPDETDDDKGVGITLWDFEANYAFEEAFDPDFDANAPHSRGRFAQFYGHQDEGDGELYFNVAAFRKFLPEDAEAGQKPADLDYFYGRFEAEERFDFLDWQMKADLCDATAETCFENNMVADADEAFGVRTVFFNRGIGRGEATLTDGDLTVDVGVNECWNALLGRTFSEVTSDGTVVATDGACTPPFNSTLDELGVPSLDVVSDDLMDALICVAEKGIEGC